MNSASEIPERSFYFCHMPKLSKKGLAMPASPIRKLVPYAEQARKKGIKIYHLNIGQPDIETPEVAMDSIRKINFKVLEYSHSAGNESLRKGLSKYYERYKIYLQPDNFLVTTGGSEAILFTLMSCLDEGDEIIIPEPFYANYNGFAIQAGVKVVPVTSTIENGFALPPVSEFEKLISKKTKAILICNPNNPTGYLYNEKELKQLTDLIKKHDLFLLADEVYRDFCYGSSRHKSVLEFEGLEDHVVVIDSVSKRFSMCGARIGTLITRNTALLGTTLKFAQARLSPPGFGQIATEAALTVGDDYYSSVKKEYLSRRDLIIDRLNKMEGVVCPSPGGAFYAIARLPIDDADKFCLWLLESFSYENATVMLAPATGFYATPGLGKNEVRVAYVLQRIDLTNAMNCLEEALKIYPGRKTVTTEVTASELR